MYTTANTTITNTTTINYLRISITLGERERR